MRGLWANVLHETFSITSDTSNSCTLSPFSNGIPDSGPNCVSIVCPTFGLEDDASAGRQYSLVLPDLIVHLDKHPDWRHFFWFPSGLSPEDLVPFVNRSFQSEINGTVNFTHFCCVLLLTWCDRVLLSCYLRPK